MPVHLFWECGNANCKEKCLTTGILPVGWLEIELVERIDEDLTKESSIVFCSRACARVLIEDLEGVFEEVTDD
jgi:hypothetical protein